jgi:hypothetical protein
VTPVVSVTLSVVAATLSFVSVTLFVVAMTLSVITATLFVVAVTLFVVAVTLSFVSVTLFVVAVTLFVITATLFVAARLTLAIVFGAMASLFIVAFDVTPVAVTAMPRVAVTPVVALFRILGVLPAIVTSGITLRMVPLVMAAAVGVDVVVVTVFFGALLLFLVVLPIVSVRVAPLPRTPLFVIPPGVDFMETVSAEIYG